MKKLEPQSHQSADVDFARIEPRLIEKISSITSGDDPAHDLLHFKRVVATAKKLGASERAKFEVILPAAWLHDCVIVRKDDPHRKQASRLSAETAILFLREIEYPEIYFEEISHAIEAHSFSAGIDAKTIEAKIVQDADRLDGLGAIGIARCFATAGVLRRSFYAEEDPFCDHREPDDHSFTIDHFFAKLFKVAETMQTEAGRVEGARRVATMRNYLASLRTEISI